MKIVKLITINLCVLIFLLAIVEIIFRLLGWGYNNSPADRDSVLCYVHPSNYLYKSYSPSEEFGDHMIYFDSLGRRSQLPGVAKRRSTASKKIVFLGDSFTEALQVPYDSSFIGLLAAKYDDVEFLNYGVTGYSPILHYLQCKRILTEHKIKPAAVIMVLYSNDVRDDSSFINMAVLSEPDHELLAINCGKKNSFIAWIRNLYFVRMMRKTYIKWNYSKKNKLLTEIDGRVVNRLIEENPNLENTLTEHYILKTDSLLKKHQVLFYITAIPSRYKNFTENITDTLFAEKTAKWANQKNIPFIDVHSHFNNQYQISKQRFFYEIDVHANAPGHKLMAHGLDLALENHFKK